MTSTFRSVSLLVAAAALFACAASSTPPGHPPEHAKGCQPGSSERCASAMGGHAHAAAMGQMGADCPMAVEGTTVHAVDLDGAVALEFMTTGNVGELQRRVAHMAEMHAKHGADGMHPMMGGEGMPDGGTTTHDMQHDGGAMGHGMMGGGMMGGGMMGGGMMGDGMMGGGMMGGGMMAANARVETIPQGARLVLTPKAPEELEALRKHVHEHAEHAASGRCPMMAMHQQPGG